MPRSPLHAVVICAVGIARYSSVYDYAGPNLPSSELAAWSRNGQNGNDPFPSAPTTQELDTQEAGIHSIASATGAKSVVELDNPSPSIGLQTPSGSGRQWNGQIYVATPALLRVYGINPASIPSDVDVLSSRPGLSGSGVQLTYGGESGEGGGQLDGSGSGGGEGPGSGGPGGGSQTWEHEHLLTQGLHRPPNCQRREPATNGYLGAQHVDHRKRAAQAQPAKAALTAG